MIRHFDEELKELKDKLIEMALLVETAIEKSITALKNRDVQLAEEIFSIDKKIDDFEIEIEDKCVSLIATRQPVGTDLRFLIGVIKINNDLERMGDHAVNIAQAVIQIADKPHIKPLIDIPRMAELSISMLKDSLTAFMENDWKLAKNVCERDDEVDKLRDQVFRELLTFMIEDPGTISRAIHLILISRNLERIADLSTNIGEDVIYISSARVIKHHLEERQEKQK